MRIRNIPVNLEELDLTEQVIWNDNYESLSPFQKFKLKLAASAICYVRELKEIDYNAVTADELIEYIKNEPERTI